MICVKSIHMVSSFGFRYWRCRAWPLLAALDIILGFCFFILYILSLSHSYDVFVGELWSGVTMIHCRCNTSTSSSAKANAPTSSWWRGLRKVRMHMSAQACELGMNTYIWLQNARVSLSVALRWQQVQHMSSIRECAKNSYVSMVKC